MNFSETSELIKILRSAGATHFKSQDFEVYMGINPPTPYVKPTEPSPPVDMSQDTVANKEATEKLKGLIDSLKMDDAQLLDKIFPAGAGG